MKLNIQTIVGWGIAAMFFGFCFVAGGYVALGHALLWVFRQYSVPRPVVPTYAPSTAPPDGYIPYEPKPVYGRDLLLGRLLHLVGDPS